MASTFLRAWVIVKNIKFREKQYIYKGDDVVGDKV